MAYCGKCGSKIEDGAKFCPGCGAATDEAPVQSAAPNVQQSFEKLGDTPDTTSAFTQEDIRQNRAMAAVAYLGILVFIPILAVPNSRFARYHANQGLVLFICEVAYSIIYQILTSVIYSISWRLGILVSILGLVGLVFLVLAIMGIINAAGGRAKELPLIGKISIIK